MLNEAPMLSPELAVEIEEAGHSSCSSKELHGSHSLMLLSLVSTLLPLSLCFCWSWTERKEGNLAKSVYS